MLVSLHQFSTNASSCNVLRGPFSSFLAPPSPRNCHGPQSGAPLVLGKRTATASCRYTSSDLPPLTQCCSQPFHRSPQNNGDWYLHFSRAVTTHCWPSLEYSRQMDTDCCASGSCDSSSSGLWVQWRTLCRFVWPFVVSCLVFFGRVCLCVACLSLWVHPKSLKLHPRFPHLHLFLAS